MIVLSYENKKALRPFYHKKIMIENECETSFKAILLSSDDLRLHIIALSLKISLLIRHMGQKNMGQEIISLVGC